MPLKLRKNNSLELGAIYLYEGVKYLIIKSDYEKSKGYEVTNLSDMNLLSDKVIKSFYNDDAQLFARAKISKKSGKNFRLGDFIMQDGLIYILLEINQSELVFNDYPKTSCPIYFFSPLNASLYFLKEFLPATLVPAVSSVFPLTRGQEYQA